MQDGLVLRDLHQPPPPSWWPPAPGWWLLAAAVLLVVVGAWLHRRRRAARRAGWRQRFDEAITADAATERLAQASELLRRAARRARDDADRLDGEAWLRFLDQPRTRFVEGPGRLLLDGPFRASVDAREAEAALELARRRFLVLMERAR